MRERETSRLSESQVSCRDFRFGDPSPERCDTDGTSRVFTLNWGEGDSNLPYPHAFFFFIFKCAFVGYALNNKVYRLLNLGSNVIIE